MKFINAIWILLPVVNFSFVVSRLKRKKSENALAKQ